MSSKLSDCSNVKCNSKVHCQEIDDYASSIVYCMLFSDRNIPKTKKVTTIAGWNEEVEPLRDKALFWHWLWKEGGKPHNGPVAESMRASRLKYHRKVKSMKRKQTSLRLNKMAAAVAKKNHRDLFTEIKKTEKFPTPATINNCSNAKDIADIFATKYSDLYNSVGYNKDKMSSIISSVESNLSDECYNEHALVLSLIHI